MILGVGIDLVEVDRFRRMLERRPGLIEKLFTPAEREYCLQRNDPTERFAVRFAAKEAAMKSMGVGIGAVDWHDLDVGRSAEGRPSLGLSGRAAALAAELGVERLELSLTHTDTLAQAEVLAIGASGGARGQGQGEGRSRRQGRGQVRMAQWRSEVGPPAELDPLIAGGLVPIVTPAEMNAIDREAPEPVEELIARAGAALARHAIGMLGGTYGRRVVVLVGGGHNGDDGRDAARRLARRGVRVRVIEIGEAPTMLPACDLVIDAAFGSGYRIDPARPFTAPSPPPGTPVLAVDIPSGIDGLTGADGAAPSDGSTVSEESPLVADETLTFAALKPGLLFAAGARRSGRITVAEIGLDVSRASAHLVGATAVAGWLRTRPVDAHKWNSAVCVVAGAPGMEGAGALASRAALRTGSGYVRLEMPVAPPAVVQLPTEVVRRGLPATDWAGEVLADLSRFGSLVIGNGLGLSAPTSASILEVLAGARSMDVPTVIDADALTVLSGLTDLTEHSALTEHAALAGFVGPRMVLTPHDGEFARLDGGPPGIDRIAAARRLAARTGAVVLLKGPATVVAAPDGAVLVSTSGDARLATAGTGDVLAGIIGALLACGLDPFHAAAAGAFIHGRAGALGWRHGSVAGDLPWRIPAVLAELDALT